MRLFLVLIVLFDFFDNGEAGSNKGMEVRLQIVSKSYYNVIEPQILCNMTMAMPSLKTLISPWNCTQAQLSVGSWCKWTGIACDPAISGTIENIINSVSLSNNNIRGTIPSAIGLLTSLRYLFLNGNALVGTIPSTMGRLMALEMIHLENNYLTGTIPSSLKSLTKLSTLNVNDNYMTGSLDPFFSTKFINDDAVGSATSYVQINRPTGQPTNKVRFSFPPFTLTSCSTLHQLVSHFVV